MKLASHVSQILAASLGVSLSCGLVGCVRHKVSPLAGNANLVKYPIGKIDPQIPEKDSPEAEREEKFLRPRAYPAKQLEYILAPQGLRTVN